MASELRSYLWRCRRCGGDWLSCICVDAGTTDPAAVAANLEALRDLKALTTIPPTAQQVSPRPVSPRPRKRAKR